MGPVLDSNDELSFHYMIDENHEAHSQKNELRWVELLRHVVVVETSGGTRIS